ncbi:MAG: FkbM family methyltransferase [Sulfuricellaceae bacterium]|nr:FkbM family methyltransferase [Sulfuricellaceae bacterium]
MSIINRIVGGTNKQRALLIRLRESSKPVMIYGAGVYAYVLKRFLAANGITVAVVMVDAAYKREDAFMGLMVTTTEETAGQLADYHVVVGITNYPLSVDKLAKLGATEIHVIDIPDYLNMPNAFMDMEFVKEHRDQFDQALGLFADDLSRETYIAAINTKINENLDYIKPHVRPDNLYFPATEFPLRQDEVLLDVGGFTGDTVREFHSLTEGRYAKIISLEPDEENFGKLLATIKTLGLSKVLPLKIGAWDERATLRFAPKEMHIDNQITDDGAQQINVDTIDSILSGLGGSVTLIKLDINGAEYRALSGARETLRKHRPQIVVRLHRKEDFFRLPILLNKLAPDIKLYLRQRSFMSMMVVLYGVFDSTF